MIHLPPISTRSRALCPDATLIRPFNRYRTRQAFAAQELASISATGRQDVVLIPGMTAAAEPCTLARHWCETLHPENAIAQLKQNGVRALALQGRIVTREAVPLDRSEEQTSESQSLLRNSYAVFRLKQ